MGTQYGIAEVYGEGKRLWVHSGDDLEALRRYAEVLSGEAQRVYGILVIGDPHEFVEFVYVNGHEFENTGKGKAVLQPEGAAVMDGVPA